MARCSHGAESLLCDPDDLYSGLSDYPGLYAGKIPSTAFLLVDSCLSLAIGLHMDNDTQGLSDATDIADSRGAVAA